MITKIQATDYNSKYNNYLHKLQKTEIMPVNQSFAQKYNYQSAPSNFISFTGIFDNKHHANQSYDNIAVNIEEKAALLAKKLNHKEVNHWHFITVAFADTLEYIDKLDKGEVSLLTTPEGEAPTYFTNIFSDELLEKKEYRQKFKQILQEELVTVAKKLSETPTGNKSKITDSFYNDVDNIRDSLEHSDSIINGFDIYNGAFVSTLSSVSDYTNEFRIKVNDLLSIENKPLKKRLHFSNYDKCAENVLKNLNLGTNMFVTFDHNKVKSEYFKPSLIKVFNDNKDSKLNPQNTDIIEFNDNTEMHYLIKKLNKLSQDPTKNHIVLFTQSSLMQSVVNEEGKTTMYLPPEYIKFLIDTPENLHLVIFDAKDNYLLYQQNSSTKQIYNNFGEYSIPVLNSENVSKALVENKEFVNSINSHISKPALEKIVHISSQMEGSYPDKTITLLKKVSAHYVDKKEITSKDIDTFAKEADYLFKQTNKDSSIEIVFDTGKRLKDIVGKTNTKKEAENIIRQIKNKTIGTKGFIVYSQDGMAGGGRRHTAEVIAGETKVPFVSINTMDFATKDVDLFGGTIMSPEASIKKLFSLVTTQAEANPHKAAVLFIDNFEYFSIGEFISEYHQKAMAQLIREMSNAEKKGLNIVVMGSVSDPRFIGESTMKSFLFNDNIEISSPAINELERYEVLRHSFKTDKIKLAGTPEEQEKLLHSISKTLRGFSFIELKSFAKKAETIAQERNHKEVTKADMIESYLRITTGRPSLSHIEPHEKELVTKHECGHAITLQIMNDLMKKQNKPWLIPNTVNFITLDPRGTYGGAMYDIADKNHQYSFEHNFADIVCCYGGHSSEKRFYDMDGSWGVTCDLDLVTSMAENMVTAMGQGHYTGKISIANMYGEEDFTRNITNQLKEKIDADVTVLTKNALTVSDSIVETYSDFIDEFAQKYAHLVGTGDCLIDGDIFRQELAEWKAKQSPEKLKELDTLEEIILEAISASKKGKLY